VTTSARRQSPFYIPGHPPSLHLRFSSSSRCVANRSSSASSFRNRRARQDNSRRAALRRAALGPAQPLFTAVVVRAQIRYLLPVPAPLPPSPPRSASRAAGRTGYCSAATKPAMPRPRTRPQPADSWCLGASAAPSTLLSARQLRPTPSGVSGRRRAAQPDGSGRRPRRSIRGQADVKSRSGTARSPSSKDSRPRTCKRPHMPAGSLRTRSSDSSGRAQGLR